VQVLDRKGHVASGAKWLGRPNGQNLKGILSPAAPAPAQLPLLRLHELGKSIASEQSQSAELPERNKGGRGEGEPSTNPPPHGGGQWGCLGWGRHVSWNVEEDLYLSAPGDSFSLRLSVFEDVRGIWGGGGGGGGKMD